MTTQKDFHEEKKNGFGLTFLKAHNQKKIDNLPDIDLYDPVLSVDLYDY